MAFLLCLGFGMVQGQVPPRQLNAYQEGKAFFRKADFPAAYQSFLTAQEHVSECPSCDSLGVLAMIQGGRCLDRQSLFEDALVAYEKAVIRGWEKDFPKHATQARINQGFVLSKMGELERAELAMREAVLRREKIFGQKSTEHARALYDLQTILTTRGDYQASIRASEQSRSIYAQIGETKSRFIGHCLLGEASSWGKLGMFDTAEAKAEAALKFYQQLPSGVQFLPDVYATSAEIEEEQGHSDEALAYLRMAEEIYAANVGDKPFRSRGKIWASMGRIQSANGNHDLALASYGKSLEQFIPGFKAGKVTDIPLWDLFPEQDPYLLIALEGKAMSFVKSSEFLAGDPATLVATLGYLDLTFRLAGKLGEQFKNQTDRENLAQDIHRRMGTALSACLKAEAIFPGKGYDRKALAYLESAQSLALKLKLQDLAARRSLKADPAILAEECALQDSLVKGKALLDLDPTAYQSYHLKLADWDRKLDALHTAYFPAIEAPWEEVTLDITQSYLAQKDALLIEYFQTDSEYVAFGITSEKVQIQTIKREELDPKVEDFIKNMRNRKKTKERAPILELLGQELFQMLLAPFLENSSLTSNEHLIIVPDGVLASLPFGCLLTGDPDGYPMRKWPFLIQEKIIHYAWSRSLINGWKKPVASNGKTLVLGMDFMEGATRESNLGQRGDFLPLFYAQKEVGKVSDLTGGHLWLNEEAGEGRFREEASPYRILHLATHGKADVKHPELSALQLNGDGDEDGYLYAFEISGLDLAAEMVVLSACETGRGEWKKGEGVMSLGRAFAYAGCPATLVSQWNVNDRSTQELMGQYYTHLVDGKSKSEALALAKRHLIAQGEADPYYWGPFVLQGDDKALPDVAGSNAFAKEEAAFLAALLILFGGILLVIGWWRFKKRKTLATSSSGA